MWELWIYLHGIRENVEEIVMNWNKDENLFMIGKLEYQEDLSYQKKLWWKKQREDSV